MYPRNYQIIEIVFEVIFHFILLWEGFFLKKKNSNVYLCLRNAHGLRGNCTNPNFDLVVYVVAGVGAAWKVADVEEGSTVAIFGLGAVGLAVSYRSPIRSHF